MLFGLRTLAIVLSLMAGSLSYAECTDEYVANCGNFNLLNVVCKTYDSKMRPTGGSETLHLQYVGSPNKQPMISSVFNDVALYNLDINEDVTLVVSLSSQILSDIKGKGKYSTHILVGGIKADERECQEYK